jgi:hypothetical protein
MRLAYGTSMMMLSKTLLGLSVAALSLTAISAEARDPQQREQRREEQDRARDAAQRGDVRPLRSIENGIVPGMRAKGANYIGQEFDGERNRYRLKFMRGNSVIWVDVDGRTGAIIGQAGG